ncbi:MAG: hypothetical protein JNK94_00840 [Hyphomonadaceae bacterium]|nr:hypothetical protein [Hyphomonadaceae bacterium]
MRAFAALLLLSACASVFTPAPDERLAGCWIERSGAVATTMRWFASPQQPGSMSGDLLRYGGGSEAPLGQQYTLAPVDDGWRLCRTGDQAICWPVAQGRSGSLEGGLAFIDRYGERLRISVVDGTGETELFDGGRDGCD